MLKPSFLEELDVPAAPLTPAVRASLEPAVPAAADPRPDGAPGGLRVREICKSYGGDVWANNHVSLTIALGEVYELLGPNGAGKTTLVSQIIGLSSPTSGGIQLGPIDLVADPAAARRLCSYLPQSQIPIAPLRSRTAIELMGRIRGGGSRDVRERTPALSEALEIVE